MLSLRHRDRAVRGSIARLVAVLAVLAGLVVLVGPRCADGLGPMMPMAGGQAMSMSHQDTTRHQGALAHQDTVVADHGVPTPRIADSPGADTRPGGHWGGLLAACLAFVAVALVALVRLPRDGGLAIGATGGSRRAARAVHPLMVGRAPGLARLCILRT